MTSLNIRLLRRVTLVALLGVLSLALGVADADARRMGGGKSFGRQSSSAMQQRAQQPPSRDALGQSGQQTAQPAQPAPQPQQQGRPATGSRWLGPLAGLAAGLGIAALLSHFGMAAPFANMLGSLLIIGLLVFGALFIWRMLRSGTTPPVRQRMEPAYGGSALPPPERNAIAEQPPAVSGARAGSVAATLGGAAVAPAAAPAGGSLPPGVPADFDVEGFLRNAKVHFHRLQSAWDRKDLADIQSFTTPEVFGELRVQLAEEAGSNYTEVVDLHADLLGIEETPADWLASVRFAGSIREAAGAAPAPFQEIWNLLKRKEGNSGWLLAGIQQLQ